MKKLLFNLLCPSAKSLAEYAANAFAELVNKSDKESAIAKYSTMSDKAVDAVKSMTVLLNDGKIDPQEKEAVKEKLQPMFEKMLEMIKEKL